MEAYLTEIDACVAGSPLPVPNNHAPSYPTFAPLAQYNCELRLWGKRMNSSTFTTTELLYDKEQSMAPNDKPVKNASGRYDNVDFRKAVGYRYPPLKCSYNRRDVLLFVSGSQNKNNPMAPLLTTYLQANAIGVQQDERHFLYELHPKFAAFPTFPINLAFKQTDQDVFDFIARTTSAEVPGVPPFDAQRSVDGERGIEIIRPLPVSSDGLDLEIHNKVIGVYDKG